MKKTLAILLCGLMALLAVPALAEEIPNYMRPNAFVKVYSEGNLLVITTPGGQHYEHEFEGVFQEWHCFSSTDFGWWKRFSSVTYSLDGEKALICTFERDSIRSIYLFDQYGHGATILFSWDGSTFFQTGEVQH